MGKNRRADYQIEHRIPVLSRRPWVDNREVTWLEFFAAPSNRFRIHVTTKDFRPVFRREKMNTNTARTTSPIEQPTNGSDLPLSQNYPKELSKALQSSKFENLSIPSTQCSLHKFRRWTGNSTIKTSPIQASHLCDWLAIHRSD